MDSHVAGEAVRPGERLAAAAVRAAEGPLPCVDPHVNGEVAGLGAG